jgi:hypothetical protein
LRGKMRQNTAYTHCDSLLHSPRNVCCSSTGFIATIPSCDPDSIKLHNQLNLLTSCR